MSPRRQPPTKRAQEILGSTLRMVAAFVSCLLLIGCAKDVTPSSGGDRPPASDANVLAQPSNGSATPTDEHIPTNPPIDCPLLKQGIDPSHMRPFEDVERYIAFLEREDRAVWQRPDDVVEALGLTGDETVVDLGAGSGYFSFRLAKALPRGEVIAADIEPEMIRHIHHKVMAEGIENLEARLISAAAPSLPPDVDLVFICDVLHHVSDRPAWLAAITKGMPPGSRLALIEFKEGDLPEGPPESAKIPREELVKLVTNAGLVLTSERANLLPYQTFLVFRKP